MATDAKPDPKHFPDSPKICVPLNWLVWNKLSQDLGRQDELRDQVSLVVDVEAAGSEKRFSVSAPAIEIFSERQEDKDISLWTSRVAFGEIAYLTSLRGAHNCQLRMCVCRQKLCTRKGKCRTQSKRNFDAMEIPRRLVSGQLKV